MTDQPVWLRAEEAVQIGPGLTRSKLDTLRRNSLGPRANVLSDGEVLYDELLFRRWLESTVDEVWVHGPFGDNSRPMVTEERAYTYNDARLDELQARTYITPEQLLALLQGMLPSQAAELRAGGVGPRFLRPAHQTIIYVAEEALWWSDRVPGFSGRHERGYERRTYERRPLLTPPVGVRRSLTLMESARIRDAQ